jgi:phosphoglucosamine mutase
MRVVFDAGFGATALLGTEVLGRSGVDVISMNDSYDGSRINVECGSTNPGEMAGVVTESGADAGLALDGDGDRVILADEKGQIVDGDQILAILALDLIARKALPKKTVVATVMSNLGLDLAIREAGGRVVRTPVGDRSVLQAMLETGLVLGGEQSGHIILLRHGTTGDGLLAGLAVLSVMARSGRPLSELASKVVRLPQVLVNVIVNQKEKLQTSEKVATAIERAREALGHTGRVLVRPSGTEPLVRVMIEGRDGPLINKMAMELAGVVAEELGGEIAD